VPTNKQHPNTTASSMQPRKRGRPTDYLPEYGDRAIELGRLGKSHAQIAADFDVSRQTLYNWQEAHPEFLDAITRARDLAQAWWEDQGQAGLTMQGFNASLWAKQVSCRFRDDYTEAVKQELSGPGGKELAAPMVTVRLVGKDD